MARWEAGVNEFEELVAHLGFDRLAIRRVEPSDAAAPGVPPGSPPGSPPAPPFKEKGGTCLFSNKVGNQIKEKPKKDFLGLF